MRYSVKKIGFQDLARCDAYFVRDSDENTVEIFSTTKYGEDAKRLAYAARNRRNREETQ